jgi:hypothetical protein
MARWEDLTDKSYVVFASDRQCRRSHFTDSIRISPQDSTAKLGDSLTEIPFKTDLEKTSSWSID